MLIEYLPQRFQKGQETVEIISAMGPAVEKLQQEYHNTVLQLHVETATEGLCLWERMYGIVTNSQKSYEQRRRQILSKMRGTGTTTTEVVQRIAASFFDGEVSVLERHEDYSFTIRLRGDGEFPDHRQIRQAIEPVKPAHLRMDLQYVQSREYSNQLFIGAQNSLGISVMVRPYSPKAIQLCAEVAVPITMKYGQSIQIHRQQG